MVTARARRKPYRITGRSLRRGLLFTLTFSGALGIGQAILGDVLGRSSRLVRYLPVLGPTLIVPVGVRLMCVPTGKPARKEAEDLLA